MPRPRIRHLVVEGHTSIESARVDLGSINVLVGANGSGKSNFVRVLELLGRIADRDLALYVELAGGASSLVRQPGGTGIRLVAEGEVLKYEAQLAVTNDDRLVFADENLTLNETRRYSLGSSGSRESPLSQLHAVNPQSLYEAHPNLRGEVAAALDLLRGCRVFHFHDTSATAPVKQAGPTADNLELAFDARNLAAVLASMTDTDPKAYRRIVRAVRQVAPFFKEFVLREEGHDRIRLRWRQSDSDTVFSAHQMSDGTLRFVCLATLLLQPNLPGLVVLDEPELGLHPYAIVQLADMLRAAAASSQVVFATQSVTLMDQFALDDLSVVERQGGGSVFDRPAPEPLRQWLDEYSLGELWQKNLIGGRPRPDSQ
jgi:predicted ATPase